jgi:hypothetical protein
VKKLLVGMALIAATGALFFASPYIQQKLFVTDSTAAVTLNELETSELGARIIDCVNLETTVSRWWSKVDGFDHTAHADLGGAWSSTHYLIVGRIGWHVTWIAAVPLQTRPVVVYDMNGVGRGSMWSMDIPPQVINALKQCGVEYMGTWEGDPPPWFE